MIGRIGDFFRFWWALFYWNTRKTWFRMRGAHRDDCPCQNYSDSGQAFDSRCDAVAQWDRPARFRRVCPLLTQTPQGWRCSVNAESVRPFWGRALGFGGLVLAGVYFVASLAIFGALRLAHYDADYLAVAWPPRWRELRAAQEKLYANRASAAMQAGNYQEAILSLEMVTQLNPGNYRAGVALASLSQVAGQPLVADHIYMRLMRDVPDERRQTAQLWFRNLLARSAHADIKLLATTMLSEDPAERAAWLNALLFSCRQSADEIYLGQVLIEHPHLPEWCTELIGIEQLLLQGKVDRALPRLTRIYRHSASPYIPYYQVDRLLRHGAADVANDVLKAYGRQLAPDEAAFLRLRVYRAKGWPALVASEVDGLLAYPMSPRLAAQFSAWLIEFPDPASGLRFLDRFDAAKMGVDANTVSHFHAAYLVAVLINQPARAEALAAQIKQYTSSDARALQGLGELLRHSARGVQLARILPLVPLPTEVVYAIVNQKTAVPAAP